MAADDSSPRTQTKEETEEEGHAGGVEENPFVVKFSWVEETRTREYEVYLKIKDVARSDDEVKGHVPDLVDHTAFDGTSTSVIRNALGVPIRGSRLLVAIVFKRLDGTIRDLSGAEYWKVYWETFLCEFTFFHQISTRFLYFLPSGHYGLWMQGVFHRDISDGNLMYRRDKNTREVTGVLADFDLSSLDSKTCRNTERTGTVPFMALNLLSEKALQGEVKHDYAHDAESFFWVGAYDTACYDNGRVVDSAVPTQWNSLGAIAMCKEKTFYIHNDTHLPTPSQEVVWNGLFSLQVLLTQAQIFHRPKEQDLSKSKSLELQGLLPQPHDPSILRPDVLRERFLRARETAEKVHPSLLNQTPLPSL